MLKKLVDDLQKCRFDEIDIQAIRDQPGDGMAELADSLEELRQNMYSGYFDPE